MVVRAKPNLSGAQPYGDLRPRTTWNCASHAAPHRDRCSPGDVRTRDRAGVRRLTDPLADGQPLAVAELQPSPGQRGGEEGGAAAGQGTQCRDGAAGEGVAAGHGNAPGLSGGTAP